MTKKEIIKKYLGIPYVWRGRSMTSLDCYGLLIFIYKDLGIELPDYEYLETWNKDGKDYYLDYYHELWTRVDDLKDWDVILFKNRSIVVNHAGVYVGDNKFIHCYEGNSVEVSDLGRKYWDKCKYGYFRYKNIL